MKRLTLLLIVALTAAGCAGARPAVPAPTAPVQAPPVTDTTPPVPVQAPVVAPAPPVQEPGDPLGTPCGGAGANAKSGTPAQVQGTREELAPFFKAAASSFTGVFVVRGGRLELVRDGRTEQVLTGKAPAVLNVRDGQALVTDGAGMFLYTPGQGAPVLIDGLPLIRQAVRRGNTFVLVAGKSWLRWIPGQQPTPLPLPENLRGINEVSISPDGRYAVASFDIDPPGNQSMGAVWAYDLQRGAVAGKWPDPMPKVGGYGAWLLGWSDQHTLRFMTGRQSFNRGHTWALPGPEDPNDRTEYRAMETPWPTSDGSWLLYRDIPERIVVQSVQPGAKPLVVCFGSGGLYNQRILSNGHIAFTQGAKDWWEWFPDGTLRRWPDVTALY